MKSYITKNSRRSTDKVRVVPIPEFPYLLVIDREKPRVFEPYLERCTNRTLFVCILTGLPPDGVYTRGFRENREGRYHTSRLLTEPLFKTRPTHRAFGPEPLVRV